MEQLLTIDELAAKLAVKHSAIRAWCSQNRIPFIRVGRRSVRFSPVEIERWLKVKPEVSNNDAGRLG